MTRRPYKEIARRLHGSNGRMFIHVDGGIWKDTDNGRIGTRAELVDAWLAEMQARDADAEASRNAATYWLASAGSRPEALN